MDRDISSGQIYLLKINAMHKLRSHIGCEDFGGITNGVPYRYRVVPLSVMVMRVLCNLRKGQGETRLNYYYNNLVSYSCGYLSIILCHQHAEESRLKWFPRSDIISPNLENQTPS